MFSILSDVKHDYQVTLNVTAAIVVQKLILSLHAAGGVALGGGVVPTSSQGCADGSITPPLCSKLQKS